MSVDWLVIIFIALLLVSAFFSASETSMFSINRYRLRHRVRKKIPAAKRVAELLKEPDRLLGVILLGNTFANVLATTVATLLAVHWFGQVGALYATIGITAIILIFGESVPKTWAVMHAQKVAYRVAWILKGLSWILYPLVWILSQCARALLFCLGSPVKVQVVAEPISADELHTLVRDVSGGMAEKSRGMMLRMIELNKAQVADVMVPRSDIYGIDVQDSLEAIKNKLLASPHRYVPLYAEFVDHMMGAISVRKALVMFANDTLTKASLIALAQKNVFIPETAPIHKQLSAFQHKKYNLAVVVDEYGDVQGIITLKDILEDIVGEFEEEDFFETSDDGIVRIEEGAFLVEGRMSLRQLNREIPCELPLDGPKTISGFIIAYLEGMPTHACCIKTHQLNIEIVEFNDLAIQKVKIYTV
jgi:Mg2+/Co2+ transporter CorB